MSKIDVIRAWKDEAFRLSLSAEQRAALPANPAGAIELEDVQLDGVAGGTNGDCSCGGSSGGGTGGNCCRASLK